MRVNTVSEVYNFARFIADAAFHTCAALGGRGESQRPGPLVTFGTESNASAALQIRDIEDAVPYTVYANNQLSTKRSDNILPYAIAA